MKMALLNLHKRLHDVDKFNFSKSQIIGRAKSCWLGIDEYENYKVAVIILRYGRKRFMIKSHYTKMNNLTSPTYSAALLRAFSDTAVETHKMLGEFWRNPNKIFFQEKLCVRCGLN